MNVEENNATQLWIAPTPTNEVVKIKAISSDNKSMVVKIMDAKGKLISSYNAYGNAVF